MGSNFAAASEWHWRPAPRRATRRVDGLRRVLTSGFVFGVAIDFAVIGSLAAILRAIDAYRLSKIEV